MTKNSKATSSQRSSESNSNREGLTISLIGAGDQRYSMYELVELSNEGAFLGGALLLEKGESLALEITTPQALVRSMRAQVVDVVLNKDTVGGGPSGVRVKWSELSDSDQKFIEAQLKAQQ